MLKYFDSESVVDHYAQAAVRLGLWLSEEKIFTRVFKPEDSIDIVVDKIISGTENNFVVVKDLTIVGLLYHKDIIDNSNKDIFVKRTSQFQPCHS